MARKTKRVPGGHRTHLGCSGSGGNGPGKCPDCGAKWSSGFGALVHDLNTDSHATFQGVRDGRLVWLVRVPA